MINSGPAARPVASCPTNFSRKRWAAVTVRSREVGAVRVYPPRRERPGLKLHSHLVWSFISVFGKSHPRILHHFATGGSVIRPYLPPSLNYTQREVGAVRVYPPRRERRPLEAPLALGVAMHQRLRQVTPAHFATRPGRAGSVIPPYLLPSPDYAPREVGAVRRMARLTMKAHAVTVPSACPDRKRP